MTKKLRILLSNDDGINAPGLVALENIARELSDDVWVVAPESEESGASRKLTLTQPLRLRELGPRRYAVQGTPTDSVLMGVTHVLKHHRPDLVLSGVNRGSNMADDVTYSGTIAAAMEATVLGIPAIALSQSTLLDDGNVKWSCAEAHGPGLIKRLLEAGWPKDVLININFPDAQPDAVKRIEVTSQGKRDESLANLIERTDARGQQYFWLGYKRIRSNPPEGTDLRAIYDGRISVTPLHLNLTEDRTRKALSQHLDGAPK